MRIDEVIVNEKPVGMLGKAKNFIQRNVGTSASKARGQGKTQSAAMANNLSQQLNLELGKRNITPMGTDPKTYSKAVLNFLSRSFDPSIIKKLGTAYVNSTKTPNPNDPDNMDGGGGNLSQTTDQFILDLISGSLKNNLPIGGDATGEAPSNMGSDEQQAVAAVAKLSKEAQLAIKNALNGTK